MIVFILVTWSFCLRDLIDVYKSIIYIYIFILSLWRFKSDHFKYLELKFVYGLKFIEQMCNFAQIVKSPQVSLDKFVISKNNIWQNFR